MTFNTINLANERVIVRGRDVHGTEGETIVSSAQWNDLNARSTFKQAEADFDAAVEQFFAPLTEAADKLTKSVERPKDSTFYVVLEEEQVGVEAKREHLIKLTKDSVILRLIEQGNTDRLVWVAGELEVAEDTSQTPSSTVPGVPTSGDETVDGEVQV